MRPGRGWLVAAGASLVSFVLLALTVTGSETVSDADLLVQRAVVGLRSSWLTPVMQTFTMLGSLPFVVGTAVSGVVILALRTRTWRSPVVLATAVALGAASIAVLKLVVARPRPGAEERIGPVALDFAFPSGHTGNGSLAWCAVTLLVCLTVRRSTGRTAAFVGALALSAGIGLSRVYLGYHWPSDVVGAWLLAATLVCAAAYAALRLRRRRPSGRSDVQSDVGSGAAPVRRSAVETRGRS